MLRRRVVISRAFRIIAPCLPQILLFCLLSSAGGTWHDAWHDACRSSSVSRPCKTGTQCVGTVQDSATESEMHQMPAILCNCTVLESQFYPSQLLQQQGWIQLQCAEDLRLGGSGHDDWNKSSTTTLMIGGA
jgi:hypothetical protein